MAAVLVLVLAGFLSLLSSDIALFYKQVAWFSVAVVFFVFLVFFDLRSFFGRRGIVIGFYVLIVLLLIATYFFAPQIKGNRAWVDLGFFQFQPSEIAKLSLIIMLAYFFSKGHIGIGRWGTIIASFIYSIIPTFLIAVQPDFGSALILIAIWIGFVLASGMPLKKILTLAIIAGVCFFGMWNYVLKDYQKDRISGLFLPERDPLGVNYNTIQSKIAIGSGGFLGKGFGQGTQTQLGFLPEAQTDFIFAAIGEEGGLLAMGLLFSAFLFMMLRILKIAISLEGNFYKFFCLGAFLLFLVQFILNVGSNLGILPVVGVTLPFVSYGGSSLLVNMIIIGMIESFYSRR